MARSRQQVILGMIVAALFVTLEVPAPTQANVALAQILGHESLNTAAVYTRKPQDELQEGVEGLRYE